MWIGGCGVGYKFGWNLIDNQIICQFLFDRRPEHFVAIIMSLAAVMEKIQERLTQVDQNNRKVVAIFQVKAGDANWGKLSHYFSVNNLN